MQILNINEAKNKIVNLEMQAELLEDFNRCFTEFTPEKINSYLFTFQIKKLDGSEIDYFWEMKYTCTDKVIYVSAHENRYNLTIPWTILSILTPEIALIDLAKECYNLSQYHSKNPTLNDPLFKTY